MGGGQHNATEHSGPLNYVCSLSGEQLERKITRVVLLGSALIMLTFVAGNFIHRYHITWLPESLLAVVFGALMGFIMWEDRHFGPSQSLDVDVIAMIFAEFLNLVALPIIIFEAGWNLRLRDFFSQLGYILLFAVVGTVISVLVVSSLMMTFREQIGFTDPKVALAYAALISSVDPVATLATFGNLNVDRLLFILVFGESQINDAVAITLFNAFNKEGASMSELILQMLAYLFGSIGLGLGLAILLILIMRFSRMLHAPVEGVLVVFVSSIFTYQLAELVSMSGIITVLFFAIMVSAYSGPHLSPGATTLISFLMKQMASLNELIIFLFVGIAAIGRNQSGDTENGFMMSLWLMPIVLVGRAAAVFPLGILTNMLKCLVQRRVPAEGRHMLSWKHMFMMWHGGVGRGGVSLWMVFEFGDWMEPELKRRLAKATCILILVFLVLFGGTTSCCMRLLKLPMGEQVKKDASLYATDAELPECGNGEIPKKETSGKPWRIMMVLHYRVMVPLLRGKEQNPPHPIDSDLLADMLLDSEEHSHQGPQPPQRRASGRNAALNTDVPSRASGRNAVLNTDLSTRAVSSRNIDEAAACFHMFGTDNPAHLEQIEDLEGEDDSDEETLSAASSEDMDADTA